MIEVKKEGIILRQADVDFESEAVLNPAVIRVGDHIEMYYRAIRIGNYSTIGYCRLDTPLTVASRWDKPFMVPQNDNERQGVEDPRLVKIDGVYYLTYVAFDGFNALGALATSTNLHDFTRHGIIVPRMTCSHFDALVKNNTDIAERYRPHYGQPDMILMDKDLVFYPRRINDKLYFMHRIKPDMQLVGIDNLADLTPQFWDDYMSNLSQHILLSPKYPHEISYVGGGCPPVETPRGWLVIYHGVDTQLKYSACAALFDLDDPGRELARLPYPLFGPDKHYEIDGDVDNVCFPTGALTEGDTLYIYYGAGDDKIACASVSLSALVTELLSQDV